MHAATCTATCPLLQAASPGRLLSPSSPAIRHTIKAHHSLSRTARLSSTPMSSSSSCRLRYHRRSHLQAAPAGLLRCSSSPQALRHRRLLLTRYVARREAGCACTVLDAACLESDNAPCRTHLSRRGSLRRASRRRLAPKRRRSPLHRLWTRQSLRRQRPTPAT